MSERVAVIGGTGLYLLEEMKNQREVNIETPFGRPSDSIIVGEIGGVEVAFLSRHGRGHKYSPSTIPYRANIFALKQLEVRRIISVSAVGSMKEEVAIGVPVIVDQFIDATKQRQSTFFDNGIVVHCSLADPCCPALRRLLIESASKISMKVLEKGTYVCIEGPQFSTRAESFMYRAMGVDVIGMTNVTEAKLAREAEICYATIALPTDYDCWHQEHEDVSVGSVVDNLNRNIEKARKLIKQAISDIGNIGTCECDKALASAIITAPNAIGQEVKQRLGLLLHKYVG
jgi:5'-methylthioadenosine phosphorylase